MRQLARSAVLASLSLWLAAAPADAVVADSLKCYRVTDPLALAGLVELDAEALGLTESCTIKKTKTYCVPVDAEVVDATANGSPVSALTVSGPNPGDRICYKIRCPNGAPTLPEVSDSFGTRTLQGARATTLCVPAVKGAPAEPAHSGATCSAEALNNLDYILDCNDGSGYEVTGTVAPISSSPELHILSIYNAGEVGGTATVTVEREQPVVLVLYGYDAVNWNVVTTPGANLQRVIVSGVESQNASVPDGVPVEIHPPWPDNLGSEVEDFGEYGDENSLILLLAAEEATGLCMSSFHQCYEATQFRIPPAP
jgi:hypothetical protein